MFTLCTKTFESCDLVFDIVLLLDLSFKETVFFFGISGTHKFKIVSLSIHSIVYLFIMHSIAQPWPLFYFLSDNPKKINQNVSKSTLTNLGDCCVIQHEMACVLPMDLIIAASR